MSSITAKKGFIPTTRLVTNRDVYQAGPGKRSAVISPRSSTWVFFAVAGDIAVVIGLYFLLSAAFLLSPTIAIAAAAFILLGIIIGVTYSIGNQEASQANEQGRNHTQTPVQAACCNEEISTKPDTDDRSATDNPNSNLNGSRAENGVDAANFQGTAPSL
jgi:hypothetical protein